MAEAVKTALVIGAAGVIGRGLMQHLDGLPDRHAIGISRRPPVEGHSAWARRLAVDLLDPADAKAKLGRLSEVTHVFYAAFVDAPDQAARVAPNLAVLRYCIEALAPPGRVLRHGTRADRDPAPDRDHGRQGPGLGRGGPRPRPSAEQLREPGRLALRRRLPGLRLRRHELSPFICRSFALA